MAKHKKVYSIRQVGGSPPESLSKLADTLSVTKEPHRRQQRSYINRRTAFVLSCIYATADIADLYSENPVIENDGDNTKRLIDDPNAFNAECFRKLGDNFLDLNCSVDGKRSTQIVDVLTAKEMAEHEERVGVLRGAIRRIKGESKE